MPHRPVPALRIDEGTESSSALKGNARAPVLDTDKAFPGTPTLQTFGQGGPERQGRGGVDMKKEGNGT